MQDSRPHPLIEHDPDEPPKDTSKPPWVAVAAVLAVAWGGSLYLFNLDWHSIALGAFSGMALAAWATEVTGNKIPASWRPGPPSGRGGKAIEDR